MALPYRAAALTALLIPSLIASCGLFGGDDEPEPVAADAGCTSDEGCKGERICVDGACVDPSQSGQGGETNTSAAGAGDAGAGDAGTSAPEIIQFKASVSVLEVGESIKFNAIVTDADGIGDIIGGTLESPEGKSYGAFITSGEEGSYTLTLSWNEVSDVVPIEFEGDNDQDREREFVGIFFDEAGHKTSKTVAVTFDCVSWPNACGGECMFLTSFSHCGACNNECQYGCRPEPETDEPACDCEKVFNDSACGDCLTSQCCEEVYRCLETDSGNCEICLFDPQPGCELNGYYVEFLDCVDAHCASACN